MVNFAELKAKAEKAKDTSVTKVSNTRDRFSSVPASRANWDPSWKRTPLPPVGASASASAGSHASTMSTGGPPVLPSRSRLDGAAADGPPVVPRRSRPIEIGVDESAEVSPPYIPRPPPTRAASGYPPSHASRETSRDAVAGDLKIDWANLSGEDKHVFFRWLDEFFSRYLGIALDAREAEASATLPVRNVQVTRAQPIVNTATRPQM